MPDTAGLDSSNLATPRPPASIFTESSRRGSFKPAHIPARDPEPSRASSPPARLTRKRAAILNTERTNLSQDIGGLALSTTASTPSSLTREQVCLCQPDPKIPRPRNAFILYRQHYQAQVIAQNPGLANPEISKIIGEQWRDQAPEIKNDWKILAEEEKQRHRRQYPGYRYQPRRAGKPTGIRALSASPFPDDLGRCPKCNGRYISTPSTPLTPVARGFEAEPASRGQHPPSLALTASTRNPPLQQSSSLSQMHSSGMESPQVSSFRQHSPRRHPYPCPQPLQTHFEKDEDMDLIPSPAADHKRRRYNPESQPKRGYPSPSPASFPPSQLYLRGGLPMSATNYRAQQPPGYDRSGSMVPGLQPSPMAPQPRHPYPARSETFDESLRLPPLITQFADPSQSFNRADLRTETRESQARSVEAMVMTIPYINKIKVLTKISPSLTPPGIGSPPRQTRGAVVAVEGADKELLSEVGALLYDHLGRDSSCAVKTWTISNPAQGALLNEGDAAITGPDNPSIDPLILPPETTSGNSFIEYLSIISEWHKQSPEITKYITTTPAPPDTSTSSPSGPRLSPPSTEIIPIALLPQGFSLTTSDTHALRIPINDSYAPVDHWQWMATLWRGIVGPDLTVYVKRVDREEMGRHGTVEIRSDCAAIVVRVLDTGRFEERTARRLGFEVLEIVRSVEAGLGHGTE